MSTEFKIGDVVVLSRAFLQSTMQFTGDAPFDEGEILEMGFVCASPLRHLLTVQWKLRGEGKVLSSNVILKSRRHLEPA